MKGLTVIIQGLVEYIKESLRPELKIKPEIVERERKFNEKNPMREDWLLNHTYLCEGDLKDLEKHPDYNEPGVDFIFARYDSDNRKCSRSKKVVVSVGKKEQIETLERKLKLALHMRGANSGVFYKRYEKGDKLIGEAVPATLSGE